MDLISMPQLGETVTEGTITAWMVVVGDQVAVDDALFEVSTEKVDTEVPSAIAGYVRAILVPEGETVPVGAPVAVMTPSADEPFDDPGSTAAMVNSTPRTDQLSHGEPAAGPMHHDPEPGDPAGSARSRPANGSGGPGAFLSPVVRRLLTENRLDPAAVAGSGRDGRITRADVLAAATSRPAHRAQDISAPSVDRPVPNEQGRASSVSPAVVEPLVVDERDDVIDFGRARAATAEHMVRSLATAAHALVVVEVDYSAVDHARKGSGLNYLPFVARAVVDAVREFPHVNASVDADRLVVRHSLNLGIAVDVDQQALVVPVVHDADTLRIHALAAAFADVADRARRRRLSGDELGGGTFTITNVGSYGTLVTAPIINQPQVAILSTDGVRMAPVAVPTHTEGGETTWAIAVHPVGNLCLSFDHRAFDGAYAAAFLARVREILQSRAWHDEVDL